MGGRQQKNSAHEESEEAQETRRAILEVARRLFMEFGYRAITTRQISDACGLTQPALYHYFKDKQELYVAMAREELARTQAGLERITRRGESVEERLKRTVAYLVGTTQHDHSLMMHDIRHELSPEARLLLNEEFRASMIAPLAAPSSGRSAYADSEADRTPASRLSATATRSPRTALAVGAPPAPRP